MWGMRNPVGVLATALLMLITTLGAAFVVPDKQDTLTALLTIAIWTSVLLCEGLLFRFMFDGTKPRELWEEITEGR